MCQTDCTRLLFTALDAFQLLKLLLLLALIFLTLHYLGLFNQLVDSFDHRFVEFHPETAYGISFCLSFNVVDLFCRLTIRPMSQLETRALRTRADARRSV